MKLASSLELKLTQTLALTPQLQQAIRLLQLSSLELEQEIEERLLENPLLEREEEGDDTLAPEEHALSFDFEKASVYEQEDAEAFQPDPTFSEPVLSEENSLKTHDDLWGEEGFPEGISYGQSSGSFDEDDEERDLSHNKKSTLSLREHLISQLLVLRLPRKDHACVHYLIEALNEDGYLEDDVEELAGHLPASVFEEDETPLEVLNIALKYLQSFEPTGVGARTLGECLALQLRTHPDSPLRNLTLEIVNQHLNLLAARDFVKLKKASGAKEGQLREAQALITRLNPRPGAAFHPEAPIYLTPEVLVRKIRGKWQAALNQDGRSRLKINQLYAEVLRKDRTSALASHLQEARWFIKNLEQRFDTILRVSQAVVDRQKDFFEKGDLAMRPLMLKEIAEALSLHESTISRVTTQKYMETPRGVFELKHFFANAVGKESDAASGTAIRAMIREILDRESPQKPLSDNKIADLLEAKGITIARRTIAKYREAMGVPTVKFRRAF